MKIHGFVSSITAFMLLGMFMLFGNTAVAVGNVRTELPGRLRARVENFLVKKKILTHGNVSVTVEDNRVVLAGTVPTIYQREEAARLTRSLSHKYGVVNDLKLAVPFVADSVIDARVMHRIQTEVPYTVLDWAQARSRKGVVTLAGWVSNPQYISAYKRQAERVVGVKKVINHLKYTFEYRRLAWRAVRLIYRYGDLFPGASLTFNPPIHVIAVDGSIILEGKTGSSSFADFLANRVSYHTNAIRVYDEIRTPTRHRS